MRAIRGVGVMRLGEGRGWGGEGIRGCNLLACLGI